jgi:hypothetical protein
MNTDEELSLLGYLPVLAPIGKKKIRMPSYISTQRRRDAETRRE